jgi:ABC-type multidrug transport system ATPase subunit
MMRDDNFLFLLDEPGTHLNPAWAIQYFKYVELCKKNHGCSQIILTTHNPLMITALNKAQVLCLTQNNDNKEIIASGIDFNPRSMGVGGILTSDLFKLRTSLGLPTQELLDERRRIVAKTETLSAIERERLNEINKELDEIEFVDSNRDPLYAVFVKEWTKQEKKEWINLPDLSPAQIDEQNKLAEEIVTKIRKQGNKP